MSIHLRISGESLSVLLTLFLPLAFSCLLRFFCSSDAFTVKCRNKAFLCCPAFLNKTVFHSQLYGEIKQTLARIEPTETELDDFDMRRKTDEEEQETKSGAVIR